MDAEPSPIEMAAQALRAPGTVRYWTDFLKVSRCGGSPSVVTHVKGQSARISANCCLTSVHLSSIFRASGAWSHKWVPIQRCHLGAQLLVSRSRRP